MTDLSPLACACTGCRLPVAVQTLDPGTTLVCASCGRSFTLSEALQPRPDPSAGTTPAHVVVSGGVPRKRRGRGLATLAVLVALIALGWWMASPALTMERQALRAYCAPLPTSDSGYPRAMPTIRNRAWMASCPSQPEGAEAFVSLPDPRIGGATTIKGERLRELLAPLRGHLWNQRLAVWVEAARWDEVEQGGGLSRSTLTARSIGHVEVKDFGSHLRTAIGDEFAAQAVLDLISGTPGIDASAIGRRMLVENEFPSHLILRPFSGMGGTRLIDQGRPPYVTAASSYFTGILLRCVGAGWPAEYRILTLRAGKG